jgi:hypothetical protein
MFHWSLRAGDPMSSGGFSTVASNVYDATASAATSAGRALGRKMLQMCFNANPRFLS